MSLLERMNDWCGEMLDKSIKYDDLITFCMMSILFIICIICLTVGILGMLGFIK